MNPLKTLALVLPIAIAAVASPAISADTTFTYQGSLKQSGGLANGQYQMTFRLFNAAAGGSQLAAVNAGNVTVVDGVFSVDLDFGANNLNNSDRWIEIVVNGTALSPRQPIRRTPYAIQTRGIFVDDNGKVGLGGTLTSELLTLSSPDANILMLSQGNSFGPKLVMRNTATGISTTHGRLIFDDGGQLAAIGYVKPLASPAGLSFSGSVDTYMKITDTGRIGIGGELNPQATLHVQSQDLGVTSGTSFEHDDLVIEDGDASLGVYSDSGGTRGSGIVLGEVNNGILADKWAIGRNTTNAGSVLTFRFGNATNWAVNPSLFNIETNGDVSVSPGGRLGVGTTNPEVALHVEGNARVNVLEVMGADLAEKFPAADNAVHEPGMVLEIDPENPGMVRLAAGEYSRLVAGVVSGANGLPAGTIMGNMPGMEEASPIALTGRVWVHCDATDASIEPGDLLTTSPTPGHAMKAEDQSRMRGAVIGKAMSRLEQGEKGMVLVLVNLQ
ncbi:MAG: hypothetical protein KC996_10410 [Phycisphaerales bacterium]|nr:hypothetical protein [Phycisphaerales bacterium]